MEPWTNEERTERINPVSLLLLPAITGGMWSRERYSVLDSVKPIEMFDMIITCPLKSKCEYCTAFILSGLSQNAL